MILRFLKTAPLKRGKIMEKVSIDLSDETRAESLRKQALIINGYEIRPSHIDDKASK